ncbi:hypothetical protein VZT92_007118 [Zoarces viviparus]|uniref:Uncharacterized protein n=1 Tax=Zoarces viviparus TaxID=48416 RepID=A0AAW1FIV3_ZOAVI
MAAVSLAPFCLADVFLLGQELWDGYLSSVAAFSPSSSSWHTGMPKAVTVQYRLHLLGGLGSVALQSCGEKLRGLAAGGPSTPHHCQTDALEMEERTQMGSLSVIQT